MDGFYDKLPKVDREYGEGIRSYLGELITEVKNYKLTASQATDLYIKKLSRRKRII